MAYRFTANTDKIRGWTTTPPSIGTICFRWYPEWAWNDGVAHEAFDQRGGSPIRLITCVKYSDNNIYIGWLEVGTECRVVTSASFMTQNAWNNFVLAWDDTANETKLYCGGTQRGSTSTTLLTLDLSGFTFTIGNEDGADSSQPTQRMADFAMYDVVWGAAEIAAFERGFAPSLIRPGNLVHAVDLIRGATDRITGQALTVTGSSVVAHPRVIMPRRRSIIVPAAGGGPFTVLAGLATETDTALGVTALKRKAVGVATETDSALATTARKSRAAGLATEFDSALAAVAKKARTVGLAEETDAALAVSVVGSGQTIQVGIAEETDSALGATPAKRRAVGLATEQDDALAATGRKIIVAGLASETDTALGAIARKARQIGLATETDSALGATVVGGAQPEPDESTPPRSGMIVTPGRLMNR